MKQQQKRRWLSMLTAGLLCLSCFGTMPVSAETADEAYENDTIATAEAIAVNTLVTGTLSSNQDVDYYAVTLEEDSSISISFAHPEQNYTNSNYWKITLHDLNGTTLRTWDSKGGATSFQTDTLGFHAGTYYIKVSCNSYSADPYTLQVHYTAASESTQLYEAEYNSTLNTANPLPVNTSCAGCIYSSDDVDYYAVTLEETGSISISFEHPEQYFTDSTYWKFSLITSDGVTMQSWDIKGGITKFQTDALGYGAGTYYLKIEDNSNYSTDNYIISVNYTAASASEQLYEAESNDTRNESNTLPVNVPCIGNLHSETDADYYAVTLEEDGLFQISFQHPEQYFTNSTYWKYTLIDLDENELCSWESEGSETFQQTEMLGFHAGTYYIKVTNASYFSADSYTIEVKFTPANTSKNRYEAEFNNTIATANAVPIATSCTGNLYSESDTDYYSFTLEESKNISVKFSHEEQNFSASSYWEIQLLSADGTSLESWESNGGTTSMQTEEITLSPGTYCLKIKKGSYHSIGNYTFQINAAEIPYTKGDVDEDGDIDLDDAFTALSAYSRAAAGNEMPLSGNPFLAADVDEDGTITMDDAFCILQYYSISAAGRTPDWDALIQ